MSAFFYDFLICNLSELCRIEDMSFRKILFFMIKFIFVLIGLGLLIILIPNLIIRLNAIEKLVGIETVEQAPVAIVFGAGLFRDGTPMPVLKERIETGVALYEAGLVDKLLMSGDNRFDYYDEPTAMFNYAIELGVPEEDVVRDFAGRRTYDSCVRAKQIFGLDKAILVTQTFHEPRAIYLCEAAGIETQGVAAIGRYHLKRYEVSWNIREALAHIVAIWDVHFISPEVVLGEEEFIFPEE